MNALLMSMMISVICSGYVFGKFVEQPVIAKWTCLPYLLVALLIILSLLVLAAAMPALLIPFSVAVVLAIALAFAWNHWK
jgi:hypothetical protein